RYDHACFAFFLLQARKRGRAGRYGSGEDSSTPWRGAGGCAAMAVSGAGIEQGPLGPGPQPPAPSPKFGRGGALFGKLAIILEMIKFEHTIFALPFALMSMLLASRALPHG